MSTLTAPTSDLLPSTARAFGQLTPEQRHEIGLCALSFRHFLPYWQFKNRETGEVRAFARVWRGQSQLAEVMDEHPWIFALKAGKLGFSELACAYDGWVARFGPANARVHMFSYSGDSVRDIFSWVRFGLEHLPVWMQLPILDEMAGGDNSRSIMLNAGPDDTRRVVAYNTGRNISIDQTCNHAHLDEFARWPSEVMWAAIQSTIAPHGSCHIITRGAGPNFAAKVYDNAKRGMVRSLSGQPMRAFFAPYDQRPGRSREWLEQQAISFGTQSAIWQFAPQTDREALQGDDTYVYPQYENPPGRHLIPAHPCELKDCQKISLGVDPGGVHPTAMGLWGERSSGRRHLYAEFYAQHAETDMIEGQIVEWWTLAGKPRAGKMRVCVPADEPTLKATLEKHLASYGIIVENALTDRNAGIQLCGRYLTTNAVTLHDSCVRHDEEFRDYRNQTVTDKQTRVEYAGDRPIKHHADAMDAFRYAMMQLSTWREMKPLTVPGGRTYGR